MATILTATRVDTPTPATWSLDDDTLIVDEPEMRHAASVARVRLANARPRGYILGEEAVRFSLNGHYLVEGAGIGDHQPLTLPIAWKRAGARFTLAGELMRTQPSGAIQFCFTEVRRRGTAVFQGIGEIVYFTISFESLD